MNGIFGSFFTAGFTPIPFKLITISAGTFNINLGMFVFASIISRSARFFLLAFLIKVYGESIRSFIEKYFNILAMLFTFLLIGGFYFNKNYIVIILKEIYKNTLKIEQKSKIKYY